MPSLVQITRRWAGIAAVSGITLFPIVAHAQAKKGAPPETKKAAAAEAKKPTVAEALQLRPVQKDVEFDTPEASAVKECTLKSEKQNSATIWIVRDGGGQPLRRFSDSNGDGRLDQWCYYKDGVEVYRDIDGNFNGKADQYRWLGTAGTRIGGDDDEDGRIDRWTSISAEEVSAEVVAAVRDADERRFMVVLLSARELDELGVSESHARQLKRMIEGAASDFLDVVKRQKLVPKDARWVHFGGGRPGVVPAGTDGSTRDLTVYDNVSAVVQSGKEHPQIMIGSLVRVTEGWRVIDLPSNLLETQVTTAPAGFFFQSLASKEAPGASGTAQSSEAVQALVEKLEKLEQQITSAAPKDQEKLNAQRADALVELIDAAANDEERGNWIHQFADTVSAAAQSGAYPDGASRLEQTLKALEQKQAAKADLAYLKFRYLSAEYGLSIRDAKEGDFENIQKQWLENLEAFVGEYPESTDAAEAMLQLAIAKEFAGEDDDARQWYARVVSDYSQSDVAVKAAGARRRLEIEGKPFSLKGTTTANEKLDLEKLRGRVVIVQYWATWCELCKKDMETIKELQAKYAKQGLTVVGVNVDNDRKLLNEFLKTSRLPWPQLHEDGGLDSRLANEMGILTLPTTLLIDKDGKVVRRNVSGGELADELKKLHKQEK